MGHDHSHSTPQNINKKFIAGICLNFAFIAVEVFYGIKANSLALLADAGHNAGDVLGLFLSWFGYLISHKKAPSKFTYGFKNATIIAAFFNSILLFAAVGGIAFEAISRIGTHQEVASMTIIIVALIGVCINGLTAYLFSRDSHHDINIKAAFLHMTFDAIVSLGVIVAGAIIMWKSWFWIDPVISLVIAVVIAISSWRLFRESLDLILLAAPTSVDLESIKKDISNFEGVKKYHDLHIWPISTTEVALSVHLVVKSKFFNDAFTKKIVKKLHDSYKISHVTIQLESAEINYECEAGCE